MCHRKHHLPTMIKMLRKNFYVCQIGVVSSNKVKADIVQGWFLPSLLFFSRKVTEKLLHFPFRRVRNGISGDYMVKTLHLDTVTVHVGIFDLAGQPRYQDVRKLYYVGIAIYVLDYNTVQLLGQFSYLSLHSIIGVLLLAGLLSPLFFNYSFKQAYFILVLGSFSHLLLDMTMWPWTGGVSLFFPFQTQRYSFRLIWPGNYFIALLFGLPLTSLAFFHLLRPFINREE